MNTPGPTFALALGAACLGVLAVVGLAFAAEVGRTEYVAAVEPICKANTQANERILAGARRRVTHGELRQAASQFERAAVALKKALRELKAVPRPAPDAPKLGEWFADIEVEVGFFEATGRDLHAGRKADAERVSAKLTTAANKANNEVLAFEFQYCRAEPSRFT